MISEEIYDELVESFDFYGAEIKIIKLLSKKKLTARETSEQTKIPMGRIYNFLRELKVKGIIKSDLSNPSRYQIENLNVELMDFLDDDYNELMEKQNRLLAKAEEEEPRTTIIHNTDEFDKFCAITRKKAKKIRRVRRDFTYPRIFYAHPKKDIEEYFEFRRRFWDYVRNPFPKNKKKFFEEMYNMHFISYECEVNHVLLSNYSFDFFIKRLKERFGKTYAKKLLTRIKKSLPNYPNLKIRISNERFPFHMLVTDNTVILGLMDVELDNINGTMIEGSKIVKLYNEIFDKRFGDAEQLEKIIDKTLRSL